MRSDAPTQRESATCDQIDVCRSLSAPKPRPSSFWPRASIISNCTWSSSLTFLNVFIISCLKFRRWICSTFLSLLLTYGKVPASWESKLLSTCSEITLSYVERWLLNPFLNRRVFRWCLHQLLHEIVVWLWFVCLKFEVHLHEEKLRLV